MVELDEVLRVLGCSTHYEVLKLMKMDHVPVYIDIQQVRKRYKELAILVHPDKNRTTDAESAFKRLSEAYECLVDEVSQRNYLQQLLLKSKPKGSRQKCKYKRKTKTPSKSTTKDRPNSQKRKRTPEEIWQEFQREEEKLARQLFHAKGFDRGYESPVKQPAQVAADTLTSKEIEYTVLNVDFDMKASNWAKWNKPVIKRTRTEPKNGTSPISRSVSPTLICCLLCRRKFMSVEALRRHEVLSELHLANARAQQS